MGERTIYRVSDLDDGKRLDVFLVEKTGQSRSEIQRCIENGCVSVGARRIAKRGERVKTGWVVTVTGKSDREIHAIKKKSKFFELESYSIDIIAETDAYIVINKPAGLVVHSDKKEEPSVALWLLKKYPEVISAGDSPERPGIVHRLDKEASGALVIAKTKEMFVHLKQQFQDRSIEKEYVVLVHGTIKAPHHMIDFSIDRGEEGTMVSRPKENVLSLKGLIRAEKQKGKEALTEFWVERRISRYTLLRVRIHTGRTHQIRVHMFAYNHPVVGDTLYFQKKLNRKRDVALGRLFLHARKLCFDELGGERVCYEAPLPEELLQFLKCLQ